MTFFDMTGKTVVITGGASGIGRSSAERLAAAGASIVLADLADATSLARQLGGRYIRTDVSDEQSVSTMMASAGPIHGLVQAAGVMSESPLVELTIGELDRLMTINACGVFLGMKFGAAHLADGGSVVNIASLAATIGVAGYAAYAASKAAALAFTRAAAIELGHRGIRVNAICPSSVDTPMLRAQANGPAEIALTRTASPLGVIGTPGHVAALVHFLLADDCPDISGQALNLDAGQSAGYSTALIEHLTSSVDI